MPRPDAADYPPEEVMERSMQHSSERILTTHTGSLPRPDDVDRRIRGSRPARRPNRRGPRRPRSERPCGSSLHKQADAGVDIVNDGEASKVGYSTYVTERLTGFERRAARPTRPQVEASTDLQGVLRRDRRTGGTAESAARLQRPDRLARRRAGARPTSPTSRHALAASDVAEAFHDRGLARRRRHFLENEYYPSDEAYVFAIADAMKHEYKAIVDAGFVLQLDCPDLAMGWHTLRLRRSDHRRLPRSRRRCTSRRSTTRCAGIPADRDAPAPLLGQLSKARTTATCRSPTSVDIVAQGEGRRLLVRGRQPASRARVGGLRGRQAARRQVLIPGVIDSTTNFVEHPELVAQRIVRYARLVGRENVIAGTDCGFATFARMRPTVHPSVTWAKFAAMAEGARLASAELWS